MEEDSMKSRTINRSLDKPGALIVMPRTEEEYDAAVGRLNALLDEVKDDEEDPRSRLIETLEVLIEKYDDEHYPMPDASPVEVLRFLMEQHDLKQSDLPEIGTQGVVSEILGGRRQLNVRQIQALAVRFAVEASAFLPATG
jgi:HTH-type transcriptional regulator/antitoxin HigA